MSSEGRIAEGLFPEVLRRLYLGRRTGMLHLTHAGERSSVCFVSGRIAWGQSTLEECRLGAVLVRHGLLAQEVLDQVHELVGGAKRLGDVLVELGALDRETLDDALALQVRETLLSVFPWQNGAWRFEEHPLESFKGYDRELRVSTGDLILDAVWSVQDPDVIRYGLGDLERTLALTTDPLLRFQRVTLSATDTRLLGLADGGRRAKETLELSAAEPQEALRSLFGLLCIGMLEWLEAPVARGAARMPAVPRRRDEHVEAPAVARPQLEQAAVAAPPPPLELDFAASEQVLASAEAEFGEGRYWDALQAVEAILDGLQGRMRRRALLLRGRVYAKNPKWQRQAEEQLTEVVGADPANSEAWFALGQFYKSAGVGVRADAMFRRVLELKPRHAGARRELGSKASPRVR